MGCGRRELMEQLEKEGKGLNVKHVVNLYLKFLDQTVSIESISRDNFVEHSVDSMNNIGCIIW